MGKPRKVLDLITIFNNPSDFPGLFVARIFSICDGEVVPGNLVAQGKTLDEVRKQLPPGLFRLEREPNDDEKIVESWF
jgi:hypothetical protein